MLAELSAIDPTRLKAVLLSADELKLAASLLYQSYHDDPLFMEIFRAEKPDYEQRLRAAIREELNTFWQAKQPMIGLFNAEQLLGVASVIAPDSGIGAGRLWHWRLKILLTVWTLGVGRHTLNSAVMALGYDHRNDIFAASAATARRNFRRAATARR